MDNIHMFYNKNEYYINIFIIMISYIFLGLFYIK